MKNSNNFQIVAIIIIFGLIFWPLPSALAEGPIDGADESTNPEMTVEGDDMTGQGNNNTNDNEEVADSEDGPLSPPDDQGGWPGDTDAISDNDVAEQKSDDQAEQAEEAETPAGNEADEQACEDYDCEESQNADEPKFDTQSSSSVENMSTDEMADLMDQNYDNSHLENTESDQDSETEEEIDEEEIEDEASEESSSGPLFDTQSSNWVENMSTDDMADLMDQYY